MNVDSVKDILSRQPWILKLHVASRLQHWIRQRNSTEIRTWCRRARVKRPNLHSWPHREQTVARRAKRRSKEVKLNWHKRANLLSLVWLRTLSSLWTVVC